MFATLGWPRAVSRLEQRLLPRFCGAPLVLPCPALALTCSLAALVVRPPTTRLLHATAAVRSDASDHATIYALSSAPGKAGIAVIRVSGSACLEIYRALCPRARPLRPRYAAVRTLHDPADPTNVLDSSALVLFFAAPRTATGEDVLELHVHGGPATVHAVLSALPRTGTGAAAASIRYAEPGEFARRAFLHDRLDLAEIEALGDALDAETEQQRRAAVRAASKSSSSGPGPLSAAYETWRAQLLAARAELEALIDFSEDQHFDDSPAALLASVSDQVHTLTAHLDAYARGAHRGQLLRQGIRLALVGPANAGKSSLLNLVAGRAAAIVSAEPGTTRDVVEARLDLRGFLCTFHDTAGFRPSSAAVGNIEAEGMRRARQTAVDADVVIALVSVEQDPQDPIPHLRYDAETVRLAAEAAHGLVVINKCDRLATPDVLGTLVASLRAEISIFAAPTAVPIVSISCRAAETGTATPSSHTDSDADPGGFFAFIDTLVQTFAAMTELPPDEQHLLGVTVRQQQLLEQCRVHLDDFLAEAVIGDTDADVVIAAEHLRYAANCLARITGRGEAGDMEEVLGVIFEKFCVGK